MEGAATFTFNFRLARHPAGMVAALIAVPIRARSCQLQSNSAAQLAKGLND